MTQTDTDRDINADCSAELALRQIVGTCCVDFDLALTQLHETDDPAGPHQARVALRRLRSALTAFAPIIDRQIAAKLVKKSKKLFRLIGKVRDADVLLHEFASPRDHAKQQAHAEKMRAKVRAALRAHGAHRHASALTKVMIGKTWHRHSAKAKALRHAPVNQIAALALSAIWAQCTSHGIALDQMPPETRHELRKDLKTLRYQTEFFGLLWPGPAQHRFLDQMRDLQDALGTLNDLSLAAAAQPDHPITPAQTLRAELALATASRLWSALAATPPWWNGWQETRLPPRPAQ